MDLKEFAQEVHQNAVLHGFWEGERTILEFLAMIHSEWSEALEAYRDGYPMVYHFDRKKPEGVAVELIDGCIRILDLLDFMGYEDYGEIKEISRHVSSKKESMDLPSFVCFLHKATSEAMEELLFNEDTTEGKISLRIAVGFVIGWLKRNGLDPYALMREKHEYNKTRPYKHGKKC